MLKKFFYWEIYLFTVADWGWAGLVITGLLLGIVLRTGAVRQRKEFKDVLIGIVIMWLLTHIISYLALTVQSRRAVLMSMLSSLAPLFTFILISFIGIHLLKIVKDDE